MFRLLQRVAPYTADRLLFVAPPRFSPSPDLFAPLRVSKVEHDHDQGSVYLVTATWQEFEATYHAPFRYRLAEEERTRRPQGSPGSTVSFHTPNPPILCTGFAGRVKAGVDRDLFAFMDEDNDKESNTDQNSGCLVNAPLITGDDESTLVPGIFLVDPAVHNDGLSFFFVHKFRQRFAVVADAICRGLEMDTKAAVEEYKAVNMYLKQYDCCTDTCGDVC